jgi:hypothetical protein
MVMVIHAAIEVGGFSTAILVIILDWSQRAVGRTGDDRTFRVKS